MVFLALISPVYSSYFANLCTFDISRVLIINVRKITGKYFVTHVLRCHLDIYNVQYSLHRILILAKRNRAVRIEIFTARIRFRVVFAYPDIRTYPLILRQPKIRIS